MSQTSKSIVIGIVCFLFGAGAFFAWSAYNNTKQENLQLKTQLEAPPKPNSTTTSAPVQTSDPVETISPTQTTPPAQTLGSVSGVVGYPSEQIPQLDVFVMKESDHSIYYKTTTQVNQQNFSITNVPPGTYIVFAYPVNTTELVGGYTKAVACGLSVECTDHSLIPVLVESGKTILGIEVKDWYAPKGQFPEKP